MGGIFKWLGRRAREKSTYAGIAAVAVALGKPELAATIGQIGQVAVAVLGGGLMFMTTKAQNS